MNTLALRDLDRSFWLPAMLTARAGSLMLRHRSPDSRPLIVRPGGMGDLILLCIAAEQLGYDPRDFYWVIERRSAIWAQHLKLNYVCFDDGLFSRHWQLAGRFRTVINTEQFFGLSQATALLACGRGATLTCFDTNRAAAWADRQVAYDPDQTHETVAFQNLLAAGLNATRRLPRLLERRRFSPASEKRIVGLAGLQSASRTFSASQWAHFISQWAGGRPFWIASAEADRPVAREVLALFPGQAELFTGRFGELCDLIRRSREVLTVDGGFLHIASYYGVPVTGLFTSGREHKWAALSPGSRVVRRDDLPCQPCTWFGQVPHCSHNFVCKELDFAANLISIDPYYRPATNERILSTLRS